MRLARRVVAAVCLLAAPLLLGAPVWAAPVPPVAEEIVAMDHQGSNIKVFDQYIFASGASGVRRVALAYGYRDLQAIGARILARDSQNVTVAGSSNSLTFTYDLPASSTFFWQRTFVQPVAQVVLLAGPGIKPSGPGAPPFQYRGQVRVQGRTMVEFVATNVPAGQPILWPMTLGNPTAAAASPVMAAALVVAVGALVAALLRLRAIRHEPRPAREPGDTSS